MVGAPEFILGEDYKAIVPLTAPYQAQGSRVLLLGRCTSQPTPTALIGPVEAVALVVLANPVRPEAKETFEYFAAQGVEVKVISGDNPETVSNVAKQAGIVGAENYIDATYLREGGETRPSCPPRRLGTIITIPYFSNKQLLFKRRFQLCL